MQFFLKNLFKKDKKHKTFEGKLTYGLEQNKIDCFIDIGANFGQTAIEIMNWGYKKEIISIEPVQSCYEQLCSISKKYNNWKVLDRMAVGDFDGQIEINVSEASDLSSILEPTNLMRKSYSKINKTHNETVMIRKIDTIFNNDLNNKNIFLKIDAQGYDFKILKGAKNFLSHVKGISIEAALGPLYENQEYDYFDTICYLRELGMNPYLISERSFNRRTLRQLEVDLVFFR